MQQLSRKYVLAFVSGVVAYLSVMMLLGINTSKQVTVVVDGIKHEISTTDMYVKDVLDEFVVDAVDHAYLSNQSDVDMIHDGYTVEIQTKKAVDLLINQNITTVHTYVNSVADLLAEQNTALLQTSSDASRLGAVADQEVKNEQYILANVSPETHLNELSAPIELIKETFLEQSHVIEIPANVEYTYTRELNVGEERVIQEGVSQIQVEKKFLYYRNDELIETTSTVEEVQQAGAPKIIEKGINSTIAPPQPYGVWDELSFCEAGGRWNANTGNGYSGGLQWSQSTWTKAANAVGLGHIPYAYLATRDEQILAAQAWLEKTSWAQWPSCSAKLGLR